MVKSGNTKTTDTSKEKSQKSPAPGKAEREAEHLHDTSTPSQHAAENTSPLKGGETGRVWINDQQYFDNVPKAVWEFYIGGYQPAQKWLK